jgi:hypothetical protein
MNANRNNSNNAARMERQQKKLDAGLVNAQFPGVTDIAIRMIYRHRGILKSLPRIVNFFPGSYALFRIDCLHKECVHGGFDLNQVITGMIRNHREAGKGKLGCKGDGLSADHSTIDYEIAIQYA